MNVETCPSSSSASSPTVGRTLGEDREKSSLDLSGLRNVVDSPTSQDTISDTAQPTQCTSTPRRRRIRNKCIEQFKEMSRSMTLENSGSVARDHLACERTFLAYVRTSIGCSTMGVGTWFQTTTAYRHTSTQTKIALVQLFSLNATNITSKIPRVGNVLGAIVVLLGMVVLILGELSNHVYLTPPHS